jgi:flavin reductase (DIM6/NTAB) family NADH-FMN oxidoreductase RutF
VAHTRDANGGLVLPGWLARLTCEPAQRVQAGDHWVFIARVLSMAHTEDQPLLYFAGGYQTLMPQPST